MKKMTKILSVILSVLMLASVIPVTNAAGGAKVLWTSSFEDGADGWTSFDVDGDGYGWEHKTDADSTRNDDFSGYESEGCMASASYLNGNTLTPENYFVSPETELESKYYQPVLGWYAGASDARYSTENYSVYVYAGEEEITAENIKSVTENSQLVYSETLQTSEFTGNTVEIDNSYIGKSIRIIFVHHDSIEVSSLKIDEVFVAAAEKVDGVEVFDITAPYVGKKPDTTAEIALTADGKDVEYTSYNVYWQQKAEDEWTAMDSASFKTGLSYRACCEITVEGEYIFSDTFETAAINGENAEIISENAVLSTVVLAYEWAPMYQLTWDWGETMKADIYTEGETPVEPDEIIKKGKIFKGWDKKIPETVTEDITLTAQWEDEVYTVIFDVDGVTTSAEYKYGDTIDVPANPEKEYYVFTGWTPEVPETMNDIGDTGDSVTYSATWKLQEFTITWTAEGVEDYVVTYEYGAAVEYYVPEREGYVFADWNEIVPDSMPDENLVFTGEWTPATDTDYTVNIHTMNTVGEYETETTTFEGTTEETVSAEYTVEEGFVLNAENSVTEGVIAADGSLVLDVYIDRKTVTITLDPDNGDEPVVLTGLYGAEVICQETPKREGYIFEGWIDSEGNETDIPAVFPADDAEYKGLWGYSTDTEYTVNIHTMNTVGEYETETTILEGTTADTVSAEYTVEEGFVLNEENSVTEGVIAADGTLVLDVYIDRKTVTLTLDPDNGDEPIVLTGLYGAEAVIDAVPEKTGYSFAGWEPEVPAVFPAEDGEYKAVWTVNQYTLTFNADGGSFADGSEETVITVNYGDAVTAPEIPEKLGYTFAGWDNEVPSTMVAENMTFTATWTDAERNVEYYSEGVLYALFNLSEGDAFEVPEAPAKEGYAFSHWSLTENGEAAELPETMPAPEEGVVLKYYAVFTVNEYTLTWDIDGELTEVGYDFGEAIEVIGNPVKEGHVFDEWSGLVETMPAGNVTVTATWNIESYTLVFDTDGGSETDDITAQYGASIEIPADPEKEGYTFAGWSEEIPAVMPDLGENGAVKTFTASWVINEYTVTWVVDGEETVDTYEFGTEVTAHADPVKEGYIFAGWDKDIPATMPAENMTITAQWTANEYDAVFNAGEGAFADGTATKTVATKFGEIPAAPEAPVKEGYIFKEWTPALEAIGVEGAVYTAVYYADTVNYTVNVYTMGTDGEYGEPASETRSGTSDTAVTVAPEEKEGFTVDTEKSVLEGNASADGTLVLSVYYSRNQYDFTVDIDGEKTTEKVYYEAILTAPEAPVKEGHAFDKWSGLTDKMPAENLTVTAEWTVESYTLKFDTDSGSEIGDITAQYGASIEIPADPEKEGYTFAGWSEEIPAVMPDLGENGAVKTFTASWVINEYTVTWVVDGEETVDTYEFGAEINTPADPEKEGYVFAGWNGAIPETMPAENLVFTASWVNATDTQYKVLVYTMKADGSYGSPASSIKTGETGTVVDAEYTVPEGFELNGEKSVTSGTIKADGSLLLEVYIDRKTVTITFDTDGGSGIAPLKGLYGTDVVITENTEKEGHTFKEWEGYADKFPAEDVTFVAVWTVNVYTVTFKNIGLEGNADLVVDYPYGAVIEVPEVKTSVGMTFTGWDKEIPATMPAENLVFSAKKTINKYNATFDANGGKIALADGTMSDKRVNSVSYNSTVRLPADPVREGYVFAGWEGYKQGMKMPANDVTFVAKWNPAGDTKYTVNTHTMGTDGSYVTSTESFTAATDSTVFAKYTVEDGFIVSKNSVTSGVVAADGSLVLDVYLERKTVTINFDSNGGSEVSAITQLYGTVLTAPANPVREGYTFNGWDIEVPPTMPAASIIITAKWTVNTYTVTFDADGGMFDDGSEEKAVQVDFGGNINAPANPVKAGYTFIGWTEFPEVMPAADVSVTALWEANTYDAVFKANGGKLADGSGEMRVPTVFGEQISAPADPVRAGYIFDGWNTAVGTMNTVGGCTFEAKWKPASDTKYTVNIYTMGTDGNYVRQTSTLEGVTGEVVNAAYSVPAGFELSNTKNNVTSGTIAADGSLVLNVYLDRKLVTITFDTNGGSAVDSVTQIYGSKVNVPENPVRKGYKFAGWKNLPSTMPASDMTVYATYTCIATVSINNNTGSKTINYGETLRLTASAANIPENTAIYWYVDGVKRGEGETFDISFESGTKTVTVKLVDKATGEVLENEFGTEIGDLENVSVNAGIFQKIISFIMNLFGMNRTVSQVFGIF